MKMRNGYERRMRGCTVPFAHYSKIIPNINNNDSRSSQCATFLQRSSRTALVHSPPVTHHGARSAPPAFSSVFVARTIAPSVAVALRSPSFQPPPWRPRPRPPPSRRRRPASRRRRRRPTTLPAHRRAPRHPNPRHRRAKLAP